VTLIGAYRKAIAEGKSRAEAIAYAQKVNDDVNFDYSVADAPDFMRRTGPLGTLAFQFRKYPVKMMELAFPGYGKLKGLEQLRYWVPALALSGLFGIPGFDWLKEWIKSIFAGKDIELEVKKYIGESDLPAPVKKTILYGAMSNLGVDVGRRVGMGDFIPDSVEDIMGATAGTVARVVQAMPKIFDNGNFIDTIEAISPGLANPIKAFITGETRDRRRDRTRFKYETTSEKVFRAAGARPIREAVESDAVRMANYEQGKRSDAEVAAIDAFIRVRNNPETPEYKAAMQRLDELKVNPARIVQEIETRQKGTTYERKLIDSRRKPEQRNLLENYRNIYQ
jgi:hypothetical protein